jgi:hypothetical protein
MEVAVHQPVGLLPLAVALAVSEAAGVAGHRSEVRERPLAVEAVCHLGSYPIVTPVRRPLKIEPRYR